MSMHARSKGRWRLTCLVSVIALAAPIVATSLPAVADDGSMVRKEVVKTPDQESDHAQLSMMQFFVPATRASGALVGSEYDTRIDETVDGQLPYYKDDPLIEDQNQGEEDVLLWTRDHAKPLVVTYQDELAATAGEYDILTGEEVEVRIKRDTFGAISLDDGETWKEANLSESADKSSFRTEVGDDYPGDVTEIVHATAGNQVLVAWTSKYCSQGSPAYSLKDYDGDGIADNSSEYGDDEPYELLYDDVYQVAGNQGSIDYAEWMHHGQYPFAAVGEIPYSCVWTARGTVERVLAGQGSELAGQEVWGIRWRKAERLTSGRRDAYKLSIDGVEDAGFALSWQEDPEGLRPGYGEGPGEGWSGATGNHKTDIWYSSIAFDDFPLVQVDKEDALADHSQPAPDPDLLVTGKPQPFVPMAMPVRVTDNDKCELDVETGLPKTSEDGKITQPWCYDLDEGDGIPDVVNTTLDADPDGVGDLCPVSWADGNGDGIRQATEYTVVDTSRIVTTYNAQGKQMDVCISDDGRLLNGQTASTRARLMMEGYDQDGDGTKDSAWVAMMYEESKGLGAGHPEEGEEEGVELDQGKDVMYHTFDMFQPDQAAAGHMLNLPETASPWVLDQLAAGEEKWVGWPDPPTAVGDTWLVPNDLSVALNGGVMETAPLNQYNTPIARRGSFMLNPTARLAEAGYREGMTSGLFLYKQGSQRQGGPSDIMQRRTVLPAGFDPATDNPFAVENLVCEGYDTQLTDTEYPTYPRTDYPFGLCVDDGASNLSSVTPLTYEDLGGTNTEPSHGITQRVLTWDQSQEGGTIDFASYDRYSIPIHDNRYDEDWTNEFDVAKGHRGFIDGDFVMVLYGYSPNWLPTSKGHEPYNLYVRRSFDGGVTWTTTPASLGGDGTTYDQVFGVGEDRTWSVTRDLAAGELEPARNVSLMTSSKETILDPRYSPTNIGTQGDVNRILDPVGEVYSYVATYTDAGEAADVRDPSKFSIVYETGDATVVETGGEADPWDLYGSRATEYGDEWASEDVFAKGRGVWEERWDWIENKDETMAGESSMAMSPDGQFAWVVWNQWIQHETDTNGDGLEDVTEADPVFRRLWWDDSALTVTADAGTYTAAANELVTLDGSATYDGDATTLTYEWDLDMDGTFETLGQTVDVLATGSMQGAALRVSDGAGNADVDQGWINYSTHAPRVWKVETTENPTAAGTAVDLTARFVDPGPEDEERSATIDWGDGPAEAGTILLDEGTGPSLVTGRHIYDEPGLYTVTVTVSDGTNDGVGVQRYAVVRDQQAGTVDSKKVTLLDGAVLELNAKYFNANVPDVDPTTPQGKIVFDNGDVRFESQSLEYLVITAEDIAFVKGVGTVNGTGSYQVLVSAVDGKPDLVRVKIWQGRNHAPVYDSQPGAMDDADPSGGIRKGGDITIERN